MTTTLADLVRAVLENPQDDDVRMILADWLDERDAPGDRERAEFIREQIRTGQVRDDWNVGAALIVTTGVADSLGLLGVGAAAVRRGFVHTVTLPLGAWMKHGPAVVQAAPVEAVVLADREPRHYGAYLNVAEEWSWWASALNESDDLDPDVFALLTGRVGADGECNYPSPEAAMADASRACVALARQRAGLPPLP